MTPNPRVIFVAGLLALGAIATGMLAHGGTVTMPRSERAAPGDVALWRPHLRVVDEQLAHGHVDVAVRVWHDAYAAALASRSWEGMVATGDAFMRIGHVAGAAEGARLNARRAHVTGLIRARRDGSLDGALRSADAFRELGDSALADLSLHVAADLAC